jgi:hypothetical protein
MEPARLIENSIPDSPGDGHTMRPETYAKRIPALLVSGLSSLIGFAPASSNQS